MFDVSLMQVVGRLDIYTPFPASKKKKKTNFNG